MRLPESGGRGVKKTGGKTHAGPERSTIGMFLQQKEIDNFGIIYEPIFCM